ncbi:MAG: metal-sensitive transcriptional regulator [Candidatus Berkelbacteria bacterium]|nr:metal-sensitive transcriptional regulator [Candidatus Berkelbacteria bacterium]
METKKIQNRLKRIEGQIRGVEEMISVLRPVDDIIIQLSAIRSAVDSLLIGMVEEEIETADRQRFLELRRTIKRMLR